MLELVDLFKLPRCVERRMPVNVCVAGAGAGAFGDAP
jgi:hypothetical protein